MLSSRRRGLVAGACVVKWPGCRALLRESDTKSIAYPHPGGWLQSQIEAVESVAKVKCTQLFLVLKAVAVNFGDLIHSGQRCAKINASC